MDRPRSLGLPDLSLPFRRLTRAFPRQDVVLSPSRGETREDKPEPLGGGHSHTTQGVPVPSLYKACKAVPGVKGLHLLPHCGLLMDVPEQSGYGMFPGMASPRASEPAPHSAQLSSPACSISTHRDTNLCKILFLL